MLDLRYVTENLAEVRTRLAMRGKAPSSLDALEALASTRKTAITETEALRAERNEASKAMASLDKKSDAFAAQRASLKELGTRIKELEATMKTAEADVSALILELPNLPHETTPTGTSEADNVEVRVFGDKPAIEAPKAHDELGVALGILDFERAAKISGARFTVLKGAAARLSRALISFMVDLHTAEHGYEELWPPAIVRDSALLGTGQLPKFEADVFRAERHYDESDESERVRHYLSPTAEVQVTNYRANEIFDADALPTSYCAYAPCFRSEAGSYGKDTRGLIRQHQFDKVELVHFVRPEDGEAMLDRLVGHAETVLQRLGLHYRVVQLCAGDMGFAAQKAFDIEVWLPAQNAYREISSCSWFGDFQARRAKIRYRPGANDKPKFVHTLNGSGLAVGRTLVAILEQYQEPDGSVRVPEALQPYTGGLTHIRA
ncbi:MAG: serine--tRNA ligase [Sandaracinaceae bacterium]